MAGDEGQLAKYVNRGLQKCHTGRIEVGCGGSDPADTAENTKFDPEGHLTSVTWDSGPRSAIVQASWSSNEKQSNGDEDNLMRKQKGFSLIELLIVVAIILIIAAIAIPNLLRARISANESAAVGALRTLNTAQISYNSTYPTVGFASALTNLAGTTCATTAPTSTTGCLIDSALGGGTKSGYLFTLLGVSGTPDA